MIVDSVKNIDTYKGIPQLEKVIDFIKKTDLTTLPDGKTEIDGSELYVMVQHPVQKTVEEARLEAHDVYADLQLIIKGSEYMGYAKRDDLGEPVEGKKEKDIYFYNGGFSQVLLKEGMFAVLFPQDGHAPCINAGDSVPETKLVFKCKM